MDRARYDLLIVSQIPLFTDGRDWHAPDLWARDLQANRECVSRLCVVAPISSGKMERSSKLHSDIRIVTEDSVTGEERLRDLIREYDVIQLNAGRPLGQSRHSFRFARAARSLDKIVVFGVSSDRARTRILNSLNKSLLRRVKARMVARSILSAAERLAGMSDGVFVIGDGLVERYGFNHPRLHVGTASWIRDEDLISEESLVRRGDALKSKDALDLCIAARLEPMKGVIRGIEALAVLREIRGARRMLSIYGDGPEEKDLKALCTRLSLDEQVSFRGRLPYGRPFYDAISQHELLLMTNLNEEQPRVVFDAISQGVVPVCPDSKPYRSLGLDVRSIYKVGDPRSLADAILRFDDRETWLEVALNNLRSARGRTIDAMHGKRAEWIHGLLQGGAAP